MKALFGKTFEVLERAIDLRTRRNTVLAANITNVDTPEYRAKDIPFEAVMASYIDRQRPDPAVTQTHPAHQSPGIDGALTVTHSTHLSPSPATPRDTEVTVLTSRERGVPNNVDLDQEMAKLSVNNLQYQAAVQALIKEIELLRTAITEGGKA